MAEVVRVAVDEAAARKNTYKNSLVLGQETIRGSSMPPPRRRPRKRLKGGAVPFVVDFKKGFGLVTDKDMWKIPSKEDYRRAKKTVDRYKREYRASGTRDSYEKWLLKKGYAKKSSSCSVM